MVQRNSTPPVFNVNDLERDVEEEFRARRQRLPSDFALQRGGSPLLSMPGYVEHREGVQRSASCRPKAWSGNTRPRQRTSRPWARR